jgi:ferric-dicitrate binding protein FerR (iron transport regulator)
MSDQHEPTLPGASGEGDPIANHPDPIANHPDPIANLVRLGGARPPVPAERAARVETRVYAAWRTGVSARRRARWAGWGAGLAAAAALLLALGLGWRVASQPPAPPVQVATVERVSGMVTDGAGQSLAAGARVTLGDLLQTGGAGRVALRLPAPGVDRQGPSLRLDVDTRVHFVAASTLELEQGAVYVDSGPESGQPVLVRTRWGAVTERGTQFEVRVGAGGIRVRVREGAVELAGLGSSGIPGRAWQADAGAELTLATDGRLSRGTVPAHGEAWAWVQEIAPTFRLEGRTLADFLVWVERESGWRVAWADPARAASAATTVLHGSGEGLPPEQALAAVLPTCGLADRRDGETVVVFASSR